MAAYLAMSDASVEPAVRFLYTLDASRVALCVALTVSATLLSILLAPQLEILSSTSTELAAIPMSLLLSG